MSMACFIQSLNNAAKTSPLGIVSRSSLQKEFQKQNLSQKEIDFLVSEMNDLFRAAVNQLKEKRDNKNRLTGHQRALVHAVYAVLRDQDRDALAAAAKVLDFPFFTSAELKNLDHLAKIADQRTHEEKNRVEDQIKNIIQQKQDNYISLLGSAKVSFKALGAMGFQFISRMSNLHKLMEVNIQNRIKYAESRTDLDWLGKTRLFLSGGHPFDLINKASEVKKLNQQFAKASRQASAGGWIEVGPLSFASGIGGTSLIGPEGTLQTDIEGHSQVLEYHNEREDRKFWGWLREANRKIARASERHTRAVDVGFKTAAGEMYYYNLRQQMIREENPGITPIDVARKIYQEMYGIPLAQAQAQATTDFQQWAKASPSEFKGVVDASGNVNERHPRYRVQVGHIMRSGRDAALMGAAYDHARHQVWQGKMTWKGDIKNVAYSGALGILADITLQTKRLANDTIEKGTSLMPKKTGDAVRDAAQSVVFSTFGFVNGPLAYAEDYLEGFVLYGAPKALLLQVLKRSPKLTEDQKTYMRERQFEIMSKIAIRGLEQAVLVAIMQVAKGACENSEGAGDKPNNKEANVMKQSGENQYTICGVRIPLEYLGGFSFANLNFVSNWMSLKHKPDESMLSQAGSAWLQTMVGGFGQSPALNGGDNLATKLWNSYAQASKDDQSGKSNSWDTFWATASSTVSKYGAELTTMQLPVPARLLKETGYLVVPYQQFARKGADPGLDFFSQLGKKYMWENLNAMGIQQLITIVNGDDGIGKPVFDYRHRPIDLGNQYNGKNIAALENTVRDLWHLATQGEQPPLYDEIDHWMAMNADEAVPFENQNYKVLFKDEPARARVMTDNEFYDYQFEWTKNFSEWITENYPSLKKDEAKYARKDVMKALKEFKDQALDNIENKSSN